MRSPEITYSLGEGSGGRHMTRADMLVVLFRSVNCRFWYRFKFPRRNADVLKHIGISLRAVFKRIMKKDEENA